MKYTGPNEIPPVEVTCGADEFENAIRKIGVINACEWFGYGAASAFTEETVKILCEKSGIDYKQS